MLKMLSNLPINRNFGLLIIRVGIGMTMLVFHGYSKLTGGTEAWQTVGAGMQNLGIGFAPVFWGFMAVFAEFVCSILIVLGVLFRPAVALLAFTMFVAVLYHVNLPADANGAGWTGASHALELFIVYVGLFLTGPGKFSFSLMKKQDPY